MKKILIILTVGVLGAAGFFFYRLDASKAEGGSLNVYSGQAEILRGEKTIQGKTGEKIRSGDTIKVPDGSRVSVILKDGSIFRLESGTEVRISELVFDGKDLQKGEYEVKNGKLWSKVESLKSGASWEVETPSIVAAVRGTSFNVGYLENTSRIFVYKHTVGVGLKDEESKGRPVLSGEFFQLQDQNLQADFEAGPKGATEGQVDDWIRFNIEEDNKIDGADNGPDFTKNQTPEIASSTPAITTPSGNVENLPQEILLPPKDTVQPTPPAPTKTVKALTLTTTKEKVVVSESAFLRMEALYNDNSKENVSSYVVWQQNPEIGSIKNSLNGSFFTGALEGKASIKGSFGGVESNTINISVGSNSQPVLTRISVAYTKNPPPPNLTYVGLPSADFRATAHYSDETTQDVTNSVLWSNKGTAGGSINSSGHYIPETRGTETISASLQSFNVSSQISIP